MTDQPFNSLLKETVTAPRLSGSKIQKLTEQFTSALDVSYITTFFKLNRSLPPAGQARISSLYVFDALSRAAHRESIKGKRKAEAKRCLDGLEAVVDSWVEGMIESENGASWAEGKEKARKIVDIWRKNETFPSPTIERLKRRVSSETTVATGSTTPPYEPGAPPPISPALPPLDAKSLPPVPGIDPTPSNGEGPSSSKSPTSSSALPPDILKLLGLQGQTSSSATVPPANGSPSNTPVAPNPELAAILANLPNAKPRSPSTINTTSAPPANPLAGLNFGQLAELAKVAQAQAQAPQIKSPPPQPLAHAHHSLPPFPPAQVPMPMPVPPGPGPGQHLGPQTQTQTQPYMPHRGQSSMPPQSQSHGFQEPALPPGTSRNYGRVKPLRNPQVGMREPQGRAPPPSADEGYARPFSRRESPPRRERSRSPDRRDRDGGWGSRASASASRVEPPVPVPGAGKSFTGAGFGPGGGLTLETFDMASFNPMDPSSWATLGEAWKRSRGSEPDQMELMAWMQEKMMSGGGGQGMGMGQMGGGPMGMGQAGGGSMGMGMGMGMEGRGGGGWGQQGGWQGQGGGY